MKRFTFIDNNQRLEFKINKWSNHCTYDLLVYIYFEFRSSFFLSKIFYLSYFFVRQKSNPSLPRSVGWATSKSADLAARKGNGDLWCNSRNSRYERYFCCFFFTHILKYISILFDVHGEPVMIEDRWRWAEHIQIDSILVFISIYLLFGPMKSNTSVSRSVTSTESKSVDLTMKKCSFATCM